MEMRGSSRRILRPDRWEYHESGEIKTKPRISYELHVKFIGRESPEWDWGHAIPYHYTWDHTKDFETKHDFRIDYNANKKLKNIPKTIEIVGTEWVKKGHVWREFTINEEPHTQEIWYKENWYAGTLYKDIWIEWDRGAAREEIHVSEGDGLRFRNLYKHAKELQGPPGFFWYKSATVKSSNYPVAEIWRFLVSPSSKWAADTIHAQDFGYNEWPTKEWVKVARSDKLLWTKKEKISEKNGITEIHGEILAKK